MRTTQIDYHAGELGCRGYLAEPDDPDVARPGVLVLHEALGLGEHARRSAQRLAELGYVAFAADYIGGGRLLTGQDVSAHIHRVMPDAAGIRRLGLAGLEVLQKQPAVDPARIAAVGYCFGGTMALEMARGGADLKAVIGFHSGLGTQHPEDATQILGRVLVCIGAEDPLIPAEQRAAFEAEMRAAGVDWRLYLYGRAGHGFTNPAAADMGVPGISYDADADRRSWQAMVDFLAETFGTRGE